MAELGVIVQILPTGVEINLDNLEKELTKVVKPYKIARKPIAFGLNAIVATLIIEDAPGGTDSIEEKIRGIDGVGEVTVESVSRLVG